MSAITLEVPEQLAVQLRSRKAQLPRILELGLRQIDTPARADFEGAAEVFEFLAGLPTPEEVTKLRPSKTLQARVRELLEKSRTTGLSEAEKSQWEQYEYLEHLVRIAKAKAYLRLHE